MLEVLSLCPCCNRYPEVVARYGWSFVTRQKENAPEKWIARCPWISCEKEYQTSKFFKSPQEAINWWNMGKIKPKTAMKKRDKILRPY